MVVATATASSSAWAGQRSVVRKFRWSSVVPSMASWAAALTALPVLGSPMMRKIVIRTSSSDISSTGVVTTNVSVGGWQAVGVAAAAAANEGVVITSAGVRTAAATARATWVRLTC